jgi:hypothetical protein
VACPGDGHLGEKSQVPGYFAVEDGPDYLPIPITSLWMWTGTMILHTNYDCNYGGGLLVEYPDSCREDYDPSVEPPREAWKVADIRAYPDGSSAPCCTVMKPTFLT